MKIVKVDPDKKDIIKKYSISDVEKQEFKKTQFEIEFLIRLVEGQKLLALENAKNIRKRLNINEHDTPEGYERFIQFDQDTFEMVVIDRPILEEKEKTEENVEKTDSEAKMVN